LVSDIKNVEAKLELKKYEDESGRIVWEVYFECPKKKFLLRAANLGNLLHRLGHLLLGLTEYMHDETAF